MPLNYVLRANCFETTSASRWHEKTCSKWDILMILFHEKPAPNKDMACRTKLRGVLLQYYFTTSEWVFGSQID